MSLKLAALAVAIPLAAMVCLPWASAQPPQQITPEQQAAQSTILELTGQKLDLTTRLIAAQRQVDDLQRQLTEAKKLASTEPPK